MHWLLNVQNVYGGWEWSSDSYKLDYKGYKPEPSTSNQTAWALLALMWADEAKHKAVENGITFLQNIQGVKMVVSLVSVSVVVVFHGYITSNTMAT